MRYSPHTLEEIRARLPVSAVVGRKVRLKKAGREWRGLSPFNAEKSPSFYANDQKQFYHCFSSGKHGNIFDFVMETEGLSFREAVERLAAEAGVELPKATPEAVRQEARVRGLHEVLELAAAWFEAQLKASTGRNARDYLARRGIDEATQRAFRIGYAPGERHGLRDHLAGKDVTLDAMIEAGLLVAGEEISVPYDRFRDRVMFPIEDTRGRPVAFGGRAMSAEVSAKYLNSPETPLFSKGRMLYNQHRARGAAHERGTAVAVEGYVDVIAMTGAGFAHTVAPLGTALTEDQLTLLWRMADEPILCFDGDKAGLRAAYRAIDVALPLLPPGKSLRFAILPEGQDPDDLARSGGPDAIARVLDGARPLVDMLWTRELDVGPSDTPERRAALARRVREAVAAIRDETLRRYYRDEVETRLRAMSPSPWGERGGKSGGRPTGGPGGGRAWSGRGQPESTGYLGRPVSASANLLSRLSGGATSPREAFIVGTLLAHPGLLHGHADTLAALEVTGREARSLCDILLDCALHDEACEVAVLQARIERAGLGPALARIAEQVGSGDRWILNPAADLWRVEEALKQAFVLQRRSRTLHSELRAAERALAADDTDANLVWLRDIQTELQSVDGAEADAGAT